MTHTTTNPIPSPENIILNEEQLACFTDGIGCFITDEEGVVQGFTKSEDMQRQLEEQEYHERIDEAKSTLHFLEMMFSQCHEYLDLNEEAKTGLGVLLRDQQERLVR